MGDAGRHMGLIPGRMDGRAGGRFGGRMGSVMEKRVVAPDPGGWVPTDIAGCQLWLKADAGITKDGSNYVSQWADQSGNNNHAVQATGSAQPLWVDNQLNDNPIINFNGSSNFLDFPDGMLYNLSAISVYIVVNPVMSAGMNVGFFAPSLIYSSGIELIYYDYSPQDITLRINGNIKFKESTIIQNNNWTLSNMIYNDSVTGGYKNGIYVSPYDINGGSALSFNGVYCLGRYAGSYGNFYGQMQVAEIIIYNSLQNQTDRQLVENYINTKYAIW